MTPQLKAMIVSAGVFLIGGVAYVVSTPQPATRSMAELRDAGILDGQRLVIVCPERLTKQTKRRIEAKQPGVLRPGQSYARIARPSRCFGDSRLNGTFGNCLRPSDGVSLAPFTTEVMEWQYTGTDGGAYWRRTDGAPITIALDDGGLGLWAADLFLDGGLVTRVALDPKRPENIISSLRRDLSGIDLDAGVGSDDGGDNDDVDDSFQYASTSCSLLTCLQFDTGVDAGTYTNPFANNCLGGLNRLALQPSPCMIPNGWGRAADGGWDETGTVDCRFTGPYGETDGGPRWRGFNTGPREFAVGNSCVPVECGIVAGDVPQEWL